MLVFSQKILTLTLVRYSVSQLSEIIFFFVTGWCLFYNNIFHISRLESSNFYLYVYAFISFLFQKTLSLVIMATKNKQDRNDIQITEIKKMGSKENETRNEMRM